MSLVVARKANEQIYIVSETALFPEESSRGMHFKGRDRNIDGREDILKTVIFAPDSVVCWAGELAFADDFFQQLWKVGTLNPEVSVLHEQAERISRNSGGETDFLVATRQDGRLNLSKFSKGVKEECDGVTFLGSDPAFFQFLQLEAGKAGGLVENRSVVRIMRTGDGVLDMMAKSMARLIDDIAFDVVDGFVIPISCRDDGFHYELFVNIDVPYKPPNSTDNWETVDLGSVEVGSFAYQCVELDQDGLRIPMIHFLQNKSVLAFEDRDKGVPRGISFPADSPLAASIGLASEV